MKTITYMLKQILILSVLANLSIASETNKDAVLEQLSAMEYMKSYVNLSASEKKKITQKYEKRERIYALAVKADIQKSDDYKEHMQMLGKEHAMRLFLQKHKDAMVVDEKEMHEYYDAHQKDYLNVHAYTLVRKDKKELDAYLKTLASTPKEKLEEVFTSLAKKHSEHPKKSLGGDLGFIAYNTMARPFGKNAFELEENSYTPKPFKTVLGWHIVFVKEKKMIPFEEVEKNIENILLTEAYSKWFRAL